MNITIKLSSFVRIAKNIIRKIPEEGQRLTKPTCCGYNNQVEIVSLNAKNIIKYTPDESWILRDPKCEYNNQGGIVRIY